MTAALPPELFDGEAFAAELLSSADTLEPYRQALRRGTDFIVRRFLEGEPASVLVAQRARLVDELLCAAWRQFDLQDEACTLLAVGGYGRSEMLPGSDVDIAILVRSFRDTQMTGRINAFLTFLWDIGLKPGDSVRTIRECKRAAREDVTVTTNLMEARLLSGDLGLFDKMAKAIAPRSIWSTEAFFTAKLEEQAARHHRFGDSAYRLEPNVKESPGCLRDIQMISWVAKRHFDSETLHDLVTHGFLSDEEHHTLTRGQDFLWRIRFGLHYLTGKREDRLLFDHQARLADLFGFGEGVEKEHAVEAFMKVFYRTVRELSLLNEMLLQLFQEAILSGAGQAKPVALNRRFRVDNGYIEARRPDVFQRYPMALLEVFLLLQQHPEIVGVRATTIRAIRDHLHLIDETFRQDIKHRSLFLEIIRQPRRLGHELQRMSRYGVLAAYLPVFEKVVGLMQFDLFHIYTVDEHTLMVVRNLRRFAFPEGGDQPSLCVEVMKEIAKPELLYLAGFFHDIGKGRGGDHSNLGASEAVVFCEQHGLSRYDGNLVAWLVEHHLEMSTTAQRKDLADPDVINEFAQLVGDRAHLRYLYLLTVADIRGTDPALWNGWKDALLAELYILTLSALRRGLENPIDKTDLIETTRRDALARLEDSQLSEDRIIALWDRMGEDYLLRHSADEIAWNTAALLAEPEPELPLVLLRPYTERGTTEIFVYTRDYDYLFAVAAQVLDQQALTVVDARIITSADGYTLDTFMVMDAETNQPIDDEHRNADIVAALRAALAQPAQLKPSRRHHHGHRRIANFDIETKVRFDSDTTNNRTAMQVVARDRPGVLSDVGRVLKAHGIRLQNAKIATYGERIEDYFYITDMENQPIDDDSERELLSSALIQALESD